MKPLSEVYNKDCVEGMKAYPNGYFDLAIVDPPYGIGITDNKQGMGRRKGDAKAKYKIGNWDNEVPTSEYFEQLFRVSKNQVIWGGNYFTLPPAKCFLIWDKKFSNDVSFAACEYAWTNLEGTAKIIRLHPFQEDRIHPTQKPVSLYRWIIEKYNMGGG